MRNTINAKLSDPTRLCAVVALVVLATCRPASAEPGVCSGTLTRSGPDLAILSDSDESVCVISKFD